MIIMPINHSIGVFRWLYRVSDTMLGLQQLSLAFHPTRQTAMYSDHPYTHATRALRTPWNQRSSNYKPVLGLLAALVCMAYPGQASAAALTLEEALRISAVEHPSVLARRSERNAADARLDERYDLKRVCLPQHLTWINSLSRR